MKASHAERSRAELRALATAGGVGADFAAAACAALGRALPFEFACLATTDPTTGLITGAFKTDPSDTKDDEFVRFEYEVDDVNLFSDIAARRTPVGVLDHDTAGHPDRCARYRDFLVPNFSHGHELRAALRSSGQTWGLVALYRPVGRTGFSREEAAFAGDVTELVGEALRANAVRSAVEQLAPEGPAVLLLGRANAVLSASAAFERSLAELGETIHGPLPTTVLAVAAAVHARRAGRDAPPPRVTLRAAGGRWLVLQGAAMGDGDDVVLTLDAAGPSQIIPLVFAGLGLTPREQEVTQLVLAGQDTATIAGRLVVSPYTVQDHLKAIFAKAGVRSRRELIANVFYEHYAPRLGQPLAATGGFAD